MSICLGCSSDLIAGERRVLSCDTEIVPCLKMMLVRKQEDLGTTVDVDGIVSAGCVCRSCFAAYTSFHKKKIKLLKGAEKVLMKLRCETEESRSVHPAVGEKRQRHVNNHHPPLKKYKISESSPPVSVRLF